MGRKQKRPDLTLSILSYLLSEGMNQSRIAKEFGLSQATVSRRVKRLRQSLEPTPTASVSPTETIASDTESLVLHTADESADGKSD